MKTISISTEEHRLLMDAISQIHVNPYSDYIGFRKSIRELAETGTPAFFVRMCEDLAAERGRGNNVFLLRNCPIDETAPFDSRDPLNSKYKTKRTFYGETFLELLAMLTDSPPLAYETRNNGDFFHDVYAQEKYAATQTQKTDRELFFHNDRTAHRIRSDFLMLLGMRSSPENHVTTGYVDGKELLRFLDAPHRSCLREPCFITPFDDYSRDSNAEQTISDVHPILEGEQCFRYYDTRTTVAESAPVKAKDALIALKDAITKATKTRVEIKNRDLYCFPNKNGLHNRDIWEIKDPAGAKTRWLLKTYNFANTTALNEFSADYVPEIPGLVRERA